EVRRRAVERRGGECLQVEGDVGPLRPVVCRAAWPTMTPSARPCWRSRPTTALGWSGPTGWTSWATGAAPGCATGARWRRTPAGAGAGAGHPAARPPAPGRPPAPPDHLSRMTAWRYLGG